MVTNNQKRDPTQTRAPEHERGGQARRTLQRRRGRRAKNLAWAAIVMGTIAAGVGYTQFANTAETISYRFVSIERGDVERIVSSTGVLDAVTTVQVGTQVSGIISELLVDFNDAVVRGQVVARIDPSLLEAAVLDAEATLARILAQLRQAQSEQERAQRLWNDGLTSRVEYETAQYSQEVAQQAANSAEIALDRARQNLSYATIYAPIAGTVIERNVDIGQTVAASLSAPTLFLIADDLSRMQIHAAVDESDIAFVHDGQLARFTVQAYPDAPFEGVVQQVRLQSSMQESVVTYTVVVDVDNRDGRLLPGMTATVDFIIETAQDVLTVSNAALRFVPPQESLATAREGRGGDASRLRDEPRNPPNASAAGGRVWYLRADGSLAAARVTLGITDGQRTAVSGTGVEPDMQVVAGILVQANTVTNPFQGETTPSGRGGPR